MREIRQSSFYFSIILDVFEAIRAFNGFKQSAAVFDVAVKVTDAGIKDVV